MSKSTNDEVVDLTADDDEEEKAPSKHCTKDAQPSRNLSSGARPSANARVSSSVSASASLPQRPREPVPMLKGGGDLSQPTDFDAKHRAELQGLKAELAEAQKELQLSQKKVVDTREALSREKRKSTELDTTVELLQNARSRLKKREEVRGEKLVSFQSYDFLP